MDWLEQLIRKAGYTTAQAGAVTLIQRFGSALRESADTHRSFPSFIPNTLNFLRNQNPQKDSQEYLPGQGRK